MSRVAPAQGPRPLSGLQVTCNLRWPRSCWVWMGRQSVVTAAQSLRCMQQEPRLPPAVAPLAPKALQAHRRRVHAVQRGERGRHRGIGGRALPLAELWARSVGVYAPLRGGADASALRCCETEGIELSQQAYWKR